MWYMRHVIMRTTVATTLAHGYDDDDDVDEFSDFLDEKVIRFHMFS